MEKPSLLVVDDDDVFRTVLSRELSRRGYAVSSAATGQAGMQGAAQATPDLMLLDLRLPDLDGLEVLRHVREKSPRTEVIVLTGHGTIDTAIEAIRLGAFDYVAKPCPMEELELRLQKAGERRSLSERNRVLEGALSPPDMSRTFVGESAWHAETLRQIARFGPTDAAVLVLGETGTGKEVVAKLLHATSARKSRPFVVVDCASLHDQLLQSELFGHEKGAFTGATSAKHGLFEVADKGTLFLDEVGEMSLGTQVKLLRVLETSTFRRLGGTRELTVDVRVVAATNRDLMAMSRQGLYREDLYYRLSTIRMELRPLRERPEDVLAIVRHHLERHRERTGREARMSDATLAALRAYPWPGNVRELLHALEQALIVCDGPVVEPFHLPPQVRARSGGAAPAAGPQTLDDLERAHIERVLSDEGGHRGRAATILGISERNLYRKLIRYGLG